jgi:uncharacterized protein YkwD
MWNSFSPRTNAADRAVNAFMQSDNQRPNLLNQDALTAGVAVRIRPSPTVEGSFNVTVIVFFSTATAMPSALDPLNIHNMIDAGTFPVSSITLPNRRATDEERQKWINEYHNMGGVSAFELEVIRLINEIRREHNLTHLQHDTTLSMAARYYTQIMADLNTAIGHNRGPYATNPADQHGASANVAAAFGGNLRWNGGNGGCGYRTPAELVNGWMNSPGHRRYILSPEHRFIGMGSNLNRQGGLFHYLYLSEQASSR